MLEFHERTPLPDDSFEDQLSDDLRFVADALRDGRSVADGHLLARVLHRVQGGSAKRRSWWAPTTRTAVTLTFALGLVMGVKLTHFNVPPGSSLKAGYDFHASNKPGFTMTATNPTVVFSPIKCADKSTPTQSTVTLAMSTGVYNSPANTPNWIPTGDKTSSLGFQGTLIVPNVCHGANVIFSGGTFSTTVKIT
jgi:hypothetical protein